MSSTKAYGAAESAAAPVGRTPPGPPLTATPSLLRMLVLDRLALMTTAAAHGDAVRLAIGPRKMYFFNHPDYAKHVLADNSANYHKGVGLAQAKRALGDGLLTSEGELWRKQRKVVQPAFQHKRISQQADAIVEEAGKLVARLRAKAGGEPVDVVHEMTGLTLGVLGRTLLDADLSAYGSIGRSFEAVQDQAMFEMVTQGMVPLWTPLPKQLRFRRARKELERVVGRLVADRTGRTDRTNSADHADRADSADSAGRTDRAGRPDDGDDALSRLIVSVREEPDPRVAKQRLRDELVTLLLAGHETTASTLGWAFYLLDRHPKVLERLRTEVIDVLGDRPPGFEDLHNLPYTAMVIQEVMRLYPPVWLLSRVAQGVDEVGDYHVPAGSDVLVSPYALHRHPAFWDAPEAFMPERFDPASTESRPRYAYIPFGAGPRFCIGNHLGTMEATFVLAMVVRELRLTKVPDYRVVPEAMLSLRVRGGLPMKVSVL